MRKLLLTASAIALSLGIASAAQADCNGIYLGVRGGATEHKYSKKNASHMDELSDFKLMLSGAIGYRYNYWRTEFEYVWRDKNRVSNTAYTLETHVPDGVNRYSFRSYSYMWNNYIDFAPYHWLSPYAGVGIGFTDMKYTSTSVNHWGIVTDDNSWYNNTPTKFTWSVGGGLTVKVTNRFNVDAGYRYYDMGSIRKMDVKAHEIYGGLRYVF